MFLLAFDTAGSAGGVALAQCHEDRCEILECVTLGGGTFSARLVPETASLLQKQNVTISQIGAFAVASGPGSFTGLRVGLATVKGLAEVLPKPIVAVSVLQAMAWNRASDRVLAVLDASRKEVYAGDYTDFGRKRVEESLLALDHLPAHVERRPGALVVACDPAVAQNLPGARIVDRPGPADYARIGWVKLTHGEIVGAEELDANYIRRSDAEIFSKAHAPSR